MGLPNIPFLLHFFVMTHFLFPLKHKITATFKGHIFAHQANLKIMPPRKHSVRPQKTLNTDARRAAVWAPG